MGRTGSRGSRDGKRRRRREPSARPKKETTITTEHGELAIRPRQARRGDHEYTVWELQPGEINKLPRGAVQADVTVQNYGMGGPRLYYLDRATDCSTCGHTFVFNAREQKHWYETLGFYTDSVAKDCLACRRAIRHAKLRSNAYQAALDAVAADPKSGSAQLALAQAIYEQYEHDKRGSTARGIAAARSAARLGMSEGLLLEAHLQRLAERPGAEAHALARFLDEVEGASRFKVLRRAARRRLDELKK